MKHLLAILAIFISISAFAQYRTTAFNTAVITDTEYYWSDWKESNLKLDIKDKVIEIYSSSKQVYIVLDLIYQKELQNSIRVAYKGIDKNGKRVTIRFEFHTENNNQIYIDYNDISITYIFKYEN